MTPFGTLRVHPPYDLLLSARLMSRYHGVLDTVYEGRYLRAVRTPGGPALFAITQADAHTLTLTHLAGPPAELAAVRPVLRHICAADSDLSRFYAVARADARLWRVVEPLRGLRHLHSETVFEALMLVIIEQQISLAAALRAQAALVTWNGEAVIHDGQVHAIFPTPGHIADADPLELHGLLKITHQRIARMQQIARNVVSGALDLEGVRGLPAGAAYAQLMAIKGVGHWTAAWTLIRGAGVYAYAGHNDVALRDAVGSYFLGTDTRAPVDVTAETFAQYGPDAGLAAFYTLMAWAVAHY